MRKLRLFPTLVASVFLQREVPFNIHFLCHKIMPWKSYLMADQWEKSGVVEVLFFGG
jgi:hypothetical protein